MVYSKMEYFQAGPLTGSSAVLKPFGLTVSLGTQSVINREQYSQYLIGKNSVRKIINYSGKSKWSINLAVWKRHENTSNRSLSTKRLGDFLSVYVIHFFALLRVSQWFQNRVWRRLSKSNTGFCPHPVDDKLWCAGNTAIKLADLLFFWESLEKL